MGINLKIVCKTVCLLLAFVAAFHIIPIIFSIAYSDGNLSSFLISAALCVLLSIPGFTLKVSDKSLTKREGFLIVSLGWMATCIMGSIPYLLTDTDIGFANAFFESTSGFTTTGATILDEIEVLPESLLIWRSLSQWIGGMGIIVFTLALFPILGIGGVELFAAEAPGPESQKLHPRIKEVSKRLYLIYIGLTLICLGLLTLVGGMSFFDGINHAFTTMASGGYSTKDASIAHYDSPVIEYIIIVFMFITGVNYSLLYLWFKGRIKQALQSEEFRFYSITLFMLIIFGTLYLYFNSDYSLEQSFRLFTFQSISIITTTGYVTFDYQSFAPITLFLFFCFIFLGACAGSTSGGIKMIRHLVVFKNSALEFKRILHPRAFIRLKLDGQVVRGKVLTDILIFLFIYMFLFIVGCLVMTQYTQHCEEPFLTAIGASASAISNVGPAIGDVGPMDTFSTLADFPKVFLAILMIIGRLEIYTVIILFTSYFWKNN